MNHPASPPPVVFLNGQYIAAAAAAIPIDDPAIVSGAMLTERLRTVQHRPWLVAEHLQRLRRAMKELNWWMPADYPPLEEILDVVARRNVETVKAGADISLGVMISPRWAQEGHSATVCVSPMELPLSTYSDHWHDGVPLIVPQVRAMPPNVIPAHFKHRSRMHWWIAQDEVQRLNARAMPLLLDHNLYVTETNSGNLFIVKDGQLLTPTAHNTLPGIAQAEVLRVAESLGIAATRYDLSMEDVLHADEAFVTSSTYCLLPVASLNGQPIGKNRFGPYGWGEVTNRIVESWTNEIGLDFRAQALGAGVGK